MQTGKDQIDDLLFKFFANQLNDTEAKTLLEWLNADTSHKKSLHEMADWWATAHTPLFVANLKTDFNAHLENLINNPAPVRSQKQIIRWWGKIAAAVLLLLTTGIIAFYSGVHTQSKNTQTASFEATAPLGAQSKVILPDSSIVWINAGSTIRYHETPDPQTRHIILTGEAFFEVTPNPNKPFIVESEALQIKVLGTSFNIKAYKNQETVDIVLVSGKVDVQISGDSNEPHQLYPDQMLTYNKQSEHMETTDVNSAAFYAWKNRQLKFEKLSFVQLARDLERIYNVQIKIESDRLKKELFSGSFSYDYTINSILQEIDVEKKYSWQHNGNQITIRDK